MLTNEFRIPFLDHNYGMFGRVTFKLLRETHSVKKREIYKEKQLTIAYTQALKMNTLNKIYQGVSRQRVGNRSYVKATSWSYVVFKIQNKNFLSSVYNVCQRWFESVFARIFGLTPATEK